MCYIINVISSGGRRNLTRRARALELSAVTSAAAASPRNSYNYYRCTARTRIFEFDSRILSLAPHACRPSPIAAVCKTSLPKDYPRTLLNTRFPFGTSQLVAVNRPPTVDDWILIRVPGPCDRDRKSFSSERRRRHRRRAYPNRTLVVRAHTQHTHTHSHKHTHCTHACANTILRR